MKTMGGCYNYYEPPRKSAAQIAKEQTQQEEVTRIDSLEKKLNSFFRSNASDDAILLLTESYALHAKKHKAGFIKELLKYHRLEAPKKEFPDIEYEVKFSIDPWHVETHRSKEPAVGEYLSALEFPATSRARFLRDASDIITKGTNHFFGNNGSEKLVVIEKMGKLYLKEKSDPLPFDVQVPYQEIVIKRTEKRYETSMEDILAKTTAVTTEGGKYHGKIEKDKADTFVLDTNDGRIYSVTVTIAKNKEAVQRQLELEYAGFVPGFVGFEHETERQLISGMVDLAKHVGVLYSNAPVGKGWRMQLNLTHERKYDFVEGKKQLTPHVVSLLPLEYKLNLKR